jgi:hypothetical protein
MDQFGDAACRLLSPDNLATKKKLHWPCYPRSTPPKYCNCSKKQFLSKTPDMWQVNTDGA